MAVHDDPASQTQTTQLIMEESIVNTITCIQSTLQQIDALGDFSIFVSKEVVTRPPFPYFYGLVRFIANAQPSLDWNKLLSNDATCMPQTRKEKLSFVVKLLAVVSILSHYRYDIFISPSNILCGQDVLSTHQFLRAFAVSVQSSSNEIVNAIANVLEVGDDSIYKRAVRTRATFKRFQAVARGWLVRRHYSSQRSEHVPDMSIESVHDEECTQHNDSLEADAKMKAQLATNDLLESYNEMLTLKSQVEDELKQAESKLELANDKLARILNIGSKHKQSRQLPLPPLNLPRIQPPYSAPSHSIAPNLLYNSKTARRLPQIADEAFVERVTNLSLAEREAKKKAKRIEKREHVLKQRLIRSKQKESELKLQEQRISDLADKIRRQQLQLKDQKLQFEQSKLVVPSSPTDSTSRPCSLCTEKEMLLRDVKDKVKRRMKLLNKREAEVIGRAQELRRREIKLLQLQNDIVNAQSEQSEVSSKGCAVTVESQSQPIVKKQEEINVPNRPQQKKLKRKRASCRDEKKAGSTTQRKGSTIQHSTTPLSTDTAITSIRSSFNEPTPTIIEEPQLPADDEDSSVETYNHDDISSRRSVKDTKDKRDETILDDDEVIKPIRVPTLNENVNRNHGNTIAISTDKRREPLPKSKTPSPSKQRHVFTFEKKKRIEKKNPHHSRNSESRQSSSRGSKRERRDEDDYISSFDVQMKCAMSKLKELV